MSWLTSLWNDYHVSLVNIHHLLCQDLILTGKSHVPWVHSLYWMRRSPRVDCGAACDWVVRGRGVHLAWAGPGKGGAGSASWPHPTISMVIVDTVMQAWCTCCSNSVKMLDSGRENSYLLFKNNEKCEGWPDYNYIIIITAREPQTFFLFFFTILISFPRIKKQYRVNCHVSLKYHLYGFLCCRISLFILWLIIWQWTFDSKIHFFMKRIPTKPKRKNES